MSTNVTTPLWGIDSLRAMLNAYGDSDESVIRQACDRIGQRANEINVLHELCHSMAIAARDVTSVIDAVRVLAEQRDDDTTARLLANAAEKLRTAANRA